MLQPALSSKKPDSLPLDALHPHTRFTPAVANYPHSKSHVAGSVGFSSERDRQERISADGAQE
jgi:hypothetical protein